MKIVVSRDEVKKLVAKSLGMTTTDFHLEISSENANTVKEKPVIVTTVNSNNQVIDMRSEEDKEDTIKVKSSKDNTKKRRSCARVDYTKYGIIIENFLKSEGRTASIDLEGLTPDGMLYRYSNAAKLFGFSDKISFNPNKKYNELTMSKKEED